MSIQTDATTSPAKTPIIPKDEFLSKAVPEKVALRDQVLYLVPKTFSTGSYGWSCNDRMTMVVDGKPVVVFVNMNLTVAGSKPVAAATTAKPPLPTPTLPGENSVAAPEPSGRRGMK